MVEQKLVQVNLLEGTVVRLNSLQQMLGVRNRTDALVRSVEIAHPIVEAVLAGKRVFLESEDGRARERFIIPGIGRTMNYFAVLHGMPGFEMFRPMRRAPSVSRPVFDYRAPEIEDDEQLRADFDSRFLPLHVETINASGRSVRHREEYRGDGAFVEARALASVCLSANPKEWALVVAANGRVVHVLPDYDGYRPQPKSFLDAAEWCSEHGAMITRPSWDTETFILGKHATTPGAYVARMQDGRIETWTPSDADRAATDWSGFGPKTNQPYAGR